MLVFFFNVLPRRQCRILFIEDTVSLLVKVHVYKWRIDLFIVTNICLTVNPRAQL